MELTHDPILANAVDSWLTINDPRHMRHLREFQAGLLNAGSVPGALVESNGNVRSSAVLTGSDKDEALRASDELKKLLGDGTAPQDEKVKKFAACPTDGCTTILDMARRSSGYEANSKDSENQKRFNSYCTRLLDAPFFHLLSRTTSELNQESEDWNGLIEKVADLFDGVASEDKSEVKKSLTNLVSTAFSHAGERQSTDIFTQSVLNVKGKDKKRECVVYIYSSHVSVVANSAKGGTTQQMEYSVSKLKLQFRVDQWPMFAEKVLNKQFKAVDDWLTDNTTDDGPVKTNLCIR